MRVPSVAVLAAVYAWRVSVRRPSVCQSGQRDRREALADLGSSLCHLRNLILGDYPTFSLTNLLMFSQWLRACFHYSMQEGHHKILSAVFQITLMRFMIVFTYRHATHLISAAQCQFLCPQFCFSVIDGNVALPQKTTQLHLVVWFFSCKHFHSVIVQFEPIRMHFRQIHCYMEIQMKEALQVMKVGNMYYEEDFQTGKYDYQLSFYASANQSGCSLHPCLNRLWPNLAKCIKFSFLAWWN